jgi:hypothetical protein
MDESSGSTPLLSVPPGSVLGVLAGVIWLPGALELEGELGDPDPPADEPEGGEG